MPEYDIDEILKKKPLNCEEIEELKEKATFGNEQDKEEFKSALIDLAIHIGKGCAERSKVEFNRLMEFVNISYLEKCGDSFATYFQYLNDVSRYMRQASTKAFIKKHEEKGRIKISVACIERIQKLKEKGNIYIR